MRSTTARHHRRQASSDAFSNYLEEIGTYPLLTLDEERALSERIRNGDTDALAQLECANLRFVVSIAKGFQNRGVPLADLVNEGNLGLVRAAETYDGAKGVKFISYANWFIRRAIFQALAEHSHPVRLPLGRAIAFHHINRRTRAMRQDLGREPTRVEILADLGIDDEELDTALRISRDSLSLDAPLLSGDAGKLADHLPADAGADVDGEDELSRDAVAASIVRALHNLRPRDAEVLRLYFGFDGEEPKTLEDIGARLGITRERVRQIKQRGLSRLRKSTSAPLAALR